MRGDRREDEERSAFDALSKALDQYTRGQTDLRSAAAEAGLEEWDFLQTAHALPDPVAPTACQGSDLPTFIRDRR